MSPWGEMGIAPATADAIPSWSDTVRALRQIRHRAVETLQAATAVGRPFVQPRCGVGDHAQMTALLKELEQAGPGMLSITIDSHTRLKHFATAARVLAEDPSRLNGYPLVAQGWARGRQLTEAVAVPLEVRHGSPDGRDLFAVALAAGITSFEGGGIGYNLPYSKNVPLPVSLEAWRQVDATCGRLAAEGVVIDRELFGTLTAVLMPPSISLAVTLLEAAAAARSGVRCLSIAYPQGGEVHQDAAALRSIRVLARRYLPPDVAVYPVLHEFMGVFPPRRAHAEALILHGAITARLGGATKVISKTRHEAFGIPDAEVNAQGIRIAAMGCHELLDFIEVDQARIDEEADWIQCEVAELVEPVLAGPDLIDGIAGAFASGRLDIPFSASIHARSEVIPTRDDSGAIRLYRTGNLPLSNRHRRRHAALVDHAARARPIDKITADINYFLNEGYLR